MSRTMVVHPSMPSANGFWWSAALLSLCGGVAGWILTGVSNRVELTSVEPTLGGIAVAVGLLLLLALWRWRDRVVIEPGNAIRWRHGTLDVSRVAHVETHSFDVVRPGSMRTGMRDATQGMMRVSIVGDGVRVVVAESSPNLLATARLASRIARELDVPVVEA